MMGLIHDAEHQILDGRVQLSIDNHGIGDRHRAKFGRWLCACQVDGGWCQGGDMQISEISMKRLSVFQIHLQNVWACKQ